MNGIYKLIKSQIPLLILLLTALYICLGALVIQKLESTTTQADVQDTSKDISQIQPTNSNQTIATNASTNTTEQVVVPSDDDWSFGSAILFTFSVVTTIGYGHIAPVTVSGRIFTMIYAIVGIPLGILGLANIGKYVAKALLFIYCHITRQVRQIRDKRKKQKAIAKQHEEINGGLLANDAAFKDPADIKSSGKAAEEPDRLPSWLLIAVFVGWILLGSTILPCWERELSIWDAFWFSFVSLTTIGFGDIYPVNYAYFPVTYVYLMAGLVFTTMAIDVLADYLRKIHNYGKKLTNMGSTKIWFGGSAINTKDLFSGVLQQLDVDQDTIDRALDNMDELIGNALSGKPPPPAKQPDVVLPVPETHRPAAMEAFARSQSIEFIDSEGQ